MNARVSLLTGVVMLGLFVPQAFAITGGQVDQNNTYNNVGALVFQTPDLGTIVGGSGTLIHPRVFLTAGHCTGFLQVNPSLLPFSFITFGKDALDPTTWHEIEAVFTHPDFEYHPMGNNPHLNDVGVIILKEPIYDLPLAKLPYEGFLDHLKAAQLLREPGQRGTPFTVVGYGSTLDWPPPVSVPADGSRRFAQSDYLVLTQAWLFTLMNPATGNGGTGYGDSGGPAFWVDTDGTLVLVALTSRGDPNLVATNIAWRVDIPETLDFIASVIANLPLEGR
jgi:hypothetical protein